MNILLYNFNTSNYEIQTVLKACVTLIPDLFSVYGVKMDLYDDRWVCIPVGTKEQANEYLKDFFTKKQLDLTKTNICSIFYDKECDNNE